MVFPPEGTIFRVRIDREGGTEDGLTHEGSLHVRGDVNPPEERAVCMIDCHSGYGVAEVVDDVDPDDVINFYEWKQRKKSAQEDADHRRKKQGLERLKEDSVQEVKRSPFRKKTGQDSEEDVEEDSSDEEDPLGSKNDLLSGNL